MLIKKTKIADCFVINAKKTFDSRGYFQRIFCNKEIKFKTKQVNISSNYKKGTLRGFHYQKLPSKENKIITCISGEIFNVVVDMRVGSKTYKKIFSIKLCEKDNKMLKIPAGCANCFLTLEKNTKILYFMEDFYKPQKNIGFNYRSFDSAIKWPHAIKVINQKDYKLPKLLRVNNKPNSQ